MRRLLLLAAMTLSAGPAQAAEGLDGKAMGFAWAIPFLGMLLSIALFPLIAHHFWEHHRGKVAGFWALLTIVPIALTTNLGMAAEAVLHAAVYEYIPFILLLLTLFTVAGGIVVRGNIHGAPRANTLILAIGTLLASVIGTTGAAMIMIRPLIRANDDRRHNVHVVVFFIFLVANAGGALSPLGDPPLFLGFLRGVDFFLADDPPVLAHHTGSGRTSGPVLRPRQHRLREGRPHQARPHARPAGEHCGRHQLPAHSGDHRRHHPLGLRRPRHSACGRLRPPHRQCAARHRLRRHHRPLHRLHAWRASSRKQIQLEPIREVAQLFAGIFLTIIPVIAMLKAGTDGVFAPLVALVGGSAAPDALAYFWITGGLSSFLDNAPTYLVFFELAGGDPQHLMTEGAATLAAISAGAVFMGANTYIGNAPNFMVYAMARDAGVKMPGFFGYMLWSGAILLPLFGILSLVFFA